MVRKCSHCGNVGHNSRTCTIQKHKETKFKLFGVQLIDNGTTPPPHHHHATLLKKSISLDSLPSSSSASSSFSSSSSSEKLSNGYLSDGLIAKTYERKKGVPWSEEEHRVFLVGLEKLGKGDWRGISRKFVTTRTPTQVASHAQKYFLRLTTLNKRKQRRPSLFDGAAARDKLTVQVVEKGSSSSNNNNNLKPTNNNNIQPASSNNISFGNPTPFQNISKLSNLNWFDHHGNQHHHEPYFKFLQSPINKSSSSIMMINNFQTTTNHHHHHHHHLHHLHHHHQPDLQLSLSTPKPVLEQVAQ